MNDEYGDENERVVDDETVRREIDALLELFSDPNKFAQGYNAYDAQDYKTDPCGDDAVRWCLLGALYRICSSRQTNRALN